MKFLINLVVGGYGFIIHHFFCFFIDKGSFINRKRESQSIFTRYEDSERLQKAYEK